MIKISTFAASVLAAGAIAAGAAAGATPAYADSTADNTFIQQLDQAGIPYVNPFLAVGRATAMCQLVEQGHDDLAALQFVQQTDRANASSAQDARFAAIAASVYCPGNFSSH